MPILRPSLSRRQFLACSSLAALARPLRAQTRRPAPPNIIVILADDQGWGDLSIHGNTNLTTPRIDSLGRDGALFEHFYACAVCAPTRAEFLTGRYHPRGGVRGVSTGAERLNLDETTIAQTFRTAGYATGAFGKWHNGSQFPYHPSARGFDEYYGFTSGHWGAYFNPELDHNGRLVRGQGYITDDLTNHAIDFIGMHRDRSFFCYLAFNTPHSPMQVPDTFFERFAHFEPKLRARSPQQESVNMTRAALAMCENIDWNVGRVLDSLERWQLASDTIVIYWSDNGPASWRWNGEMKGRKGSVDEGGLRVPFLVRWPGRVRSGTRIPQIAGAIDILPTLADLAGIPTTSTKPLDGKSLKPLLTGSGASWPDRMYFSYYSGRISVRTQQYRLDPTGALYDMRADPSQDRDISADQPAVAARLRQAAAEWGREMLPQVGRDDRPFTVGHSPVTMLPARDGVARGTIRRSNTAPNCSYFTNWTSTDDRVTWDIEIEQPGEFTAEVFYTCPPADLGTVFELSFMGRTVSGKITAPHDPPEVGAQIDRVPRETESYWKEFWPLSLGLIHLAKGRGELTLRASAIPGKRAGDIRYVALTRR